MKNQLHLYTIMPLDADHLEEICQDIREQYETGVATCALFNMTLVPEGDPPVDKAGALCEIYRRFQKRLGQLGVPNGVLVQASIGHGWVLSKKFPFQPYVHLTDGEEESVVCPYDEGFRQYIYDALRTIASCRPDHIMIDDDFRLIFRNGTGCACPLHMKRFHELSQTNLTREELLARLRAQTEEAGHLNDLMVETQRESLVQTAKILRSAIDSVDPTLPGSFCTVGTSCEFAEEIAGILAGQGNPVVVRINNGNYTAAGPRNFSNVFFRAAASIEKLRDSVDVLLAETDTCPQNRYSTGAMFLHTHFTGSILEGAAGAKHWITRLSSFEPKSGRAYRRILQKYRGFYESLAQLTPTLRWMGCRISLLRQPNLKGVEPWRNETNSSWCSCVLERLGLPVYFSSRPGGILCLEGEEDTKLTDAELLQALGHGVLLASDSAQRLIDRGFGEYLGVTVREWTGLQPSKEFYPATGNSMNAQQKIRELVPTDPATEEISTVLHVVDGIPPQRLFPGVTAYRNSLGGWVFTFCGTPKAEYNLVEAFSYLNETRKLQLISLLSRTDQLPLYYPNDEEVYFRTATMEDGGTFCALFNLGFDPIESVELVANFAVSAIYRLMPDGTRQAIPFTQTEDRLTLQISCQPVDPLVLFLYKK